MQPATNRRSFLQAGMLGGVTLGLTDLLRPRSTTDPAPPARSAIFIFLPGGLAQQESFDPKPQAPREYRGPLGSIPTTIPGVRLSEMLRHTAQVTDLITICRSLTHGESTHERAVQTVLTGQHPKPGVDDPRSGHPSIGSVTAHELGPAGALPPYVCIPNQPSPFAGPGILGASYDGFSLDSDPAAGDFRFRDVCDLRNEPPRLRDVYGRTPAGARMLAARRLVEAGVRFVTLTVGGWDMHGRIGRGIAAQMPALDQAFATLIRDLESRGLLDTTLVCLVSEFGRTPKMNPRGGRDHWPHVFSAALAGGGIRRGFVYGRSDPTASEPVDDPLSIEDWAATIYHCLGIAPANELPSPQGQPVKILQRANVRHELLA